MLAIVVLLCIQFSPIHYTDKRPVKFWNMPHVYYDDANMNAVVLRHYALSESSCLKPVERADLFRYAIVYEEGGVYADADTRMVVPPRKWPDGDFVIGVEFKHPLQLNQWTFAAKKGCALLKFVIEYIGRHLDCKITNPIEKTGPVIWTKAILRFFELYGTENINNVSQDDAPKKVSYYWKGTYYTGWILPYRAFSYPGWSQGSKLHPNLVIHGFRGSWKK